MAEEIESKNEEKKPKKKMNIFLKVFLIILAGLVVFNILFFMFFYIKNRIELKKEAKYLVAPGEYVIVNDHKIHMVTGGDVSSDNVLVFLHSDNIYDDSIALLPLFGYLDNCRYVYIDRSGYGFSDSYGAEKDIESIILEMKEALNELGITGPYTLVPFGTAGIQAFYWAQAYPEDVKNIIGINMNYPEQFLEYSTDEYCGTANKLFLKLIKIGAHRIFKNKLFPKDKYGIFSDDQMNVRTALAGKYAYTNDMYREQRNTVDNAKKTVELGFPEKIDIYLIYNNIFLEPYMSTDDEIKEMFADQSKGGVDCAGIFNAQFREYFENHNNVKIDEIDGPGRLYIYNPDKIASMINDYLDN